MVSEIRANVTCSLGVLISGSLSDDYLQGVGLVKTRGEIELAGIATPAMGTVVTFSYTKGGVTRTIPRTMRVMSSFADPYRRTTKVQLGCKLTYFSDLEEPINWEALDDPENAELTEEDQEIVTIPIYAKSIAAKCCEELGLDPAPVSVLTNKFSIAEFDFSGGYVQILSDLLVSESYCGYLNASEDLVLIDLSEEGGTGPVLSQGQIIDHGPIGVGQLPGEAVVVEYSTLKLRSPDETIDGADDELLWEYNESVSIGKYPLTWTDYLTGDSFQAIYEAPTFVYTQTKYARIGENDVVTDRIEYKQAPAISVAGGAASQYFSYRLPFYPTAPCFSRTVTVNTYDDKGELTRTETSRSVSVLEFAGQLNLTFAEGGAGVSPTVNFIAMPTDSGWFDVDYDPFGFLDLTSYYSGSIEIERTVQEQTQEVSQTFATISDSPNVYGSPLTRSRSSVTFPVTQQTTSNYRAWGLTIQGQQSAAESNSQKTVALSQNYLDVALGAGILLVDTEIVNNYRLTPESRPPTSALLNAETAAETGDPNNGWRTESSAEIVLALGSAEAQRRITFRMPYAPDDVFVGPSGGPFTSIPSDADQKAITYGRVQNRLLLGNRNGMNIQMAPEMLPAAPFAPLYVQANGLTAQYRCNGNQWAFSEDGIATSTDALFWSAVSGTGVFWFPVAPGVTTLPSTPPTGSGVISPGDPPVPTITPTAPTIPAYNETIPLSLRMRCGLSIAVLDYALALEEVVPLGISAGMTGTPILPINVPVASIAVAAQAPIFAQSVFVNVPATSVGITAIAPFIEIAVLINVPAVNIGISALAPVIEAGNVDVNAPVANIAITALAPTLDTGSLMETIRLLQLVEDDLLYLIE